jgi:hypothetical protein
MDIIQLAIYKLGENKGVPTVADQSLAAAVMNKVWEPTRELCLSHGNWPWATTAEKLPVDVDAPFIGWGYRYAEPNTCIRAVAVTDEAGLRGARGLRNFCDPAWRSGVGSQWCYDWDRSMGTQGTTIDTDLQGAYLIYVADVTDTNRYSPGFVEAFSALLAAQGGPPIIGPIGLQNKESLMREYRATLGEALANEYNQGRRADDITPALLARGGD